LVQAGEARYHLVKAGNREDAQHGRAGDDHPYFTAVDPGTLVRRYQRMDAGRVAELSPAHVDHDLPAASGRLEQRGPQPGGVGDVDIAGRHHHGHTPGHLDPEADVRHPR
jgi:hypothetical protein